uniref:tyrosine-protein phosphatase n=1 Tax=uncultured Sphingomonas sp. TaxID=158754 RepID=UPI0035CA9F3E
MKHILFRYTRTAIVCALMGATALSCGSIVDARSQEAPPGQAHARLIPLQGGRNFRDLGGYRTADGRHVKWNSLFRSGSMHGLTDADYESLERRGIRVVCDFRDMHERASEPVRWPVANAPRLLSDDYVLDQRGFLPAGEMKTWTEASARAAMMASYPRMLRQFHDQYRRMFAELLAGHAPLAFNCSAGKDRTGIAAALLLTALGVPRQSVIHDYLLTNTYLDAAKVLASPSAAKSPMALLPPGVTSAIMKADRRYIEAALAVLDHHEGGSGGWLRDEMGLSRANIGALRAAYLE